MAVVYLMVGVLAGLVSAAASLILGGSWLGAIGFYMFGGTAAIFATVAFALLRFAVAQLLRPAEAHTKLRRSNSG